MKKILTIVTLLVSFLFFLNVNETEAAPGNFKINPNSNPYNTKMMNYSSYTEHTKHYYLLRSYMEELEKRGGGTLTLQKGTYVVSNALYVPSNVTFIFEDGVILQKGKKTGTSAFSTSKSLFQLVAPSKSHKKGVHGGYNGEKNISFIGQGNVIIDLNSYSDSIAILAGHNRNLTIENISFQNMNAGHFLEIDAVDGAVIRNNVFMNSMPSIKENKEAINIDTPDRETLGWNADWSKFDKTPNRNITIENNVFRNLDRSVGTHKYSGGKYHENVVIRNNVIDNMRLDAIRVMNWKNPIIEGNTIANVKERTGNYRAILAGGAIYPTIRNNKIVNIARPMQFYPWKNTGPGEVYPVTFNEISEQNLADFLTNPIMNLTESFIRINNVYDEFVQYTDKINLPLTLTENDFPSPEIYSMSTVSDASDTINGMAQPFVNVFAVYNGAVIGQSSASSTGNYVLMIPKQLEGRNISVYAQDIFGKPSNFQTNTVIDGTPPSFSYSVSSTKPTTDDVIISLVASDKNGIRSISMPDGTVSMSSTATFTATASGTYTFKAYDPTGNVTTRTVKISNIDRTNPTVILTPSTTKPTNKNVTITIKGTDTSGISRIKVGANKYITGSTTTFTASKNGTYIFEIEDKAGNKSRKSIVIGSIDKKAPTTPTVGSVTSRTTIVTGKAEKSATAYVYRGKTQVGKATVDSKGNYKVKIKSQKKNTYLTIYVKDKAGNKSKGRIVKVK